MGVVPVLEATYWQHIRDEFIYERRPLRHITDVAGSVTYLGTSLNDLLNNIRTILYMIIA